MPQLDPANFAPQVIWLAISFAILYLAMARSALPRVANVLEERENRIADDLDQAEAMKGDAKETEEAYEKALVDARAEASDVLQTAREKMQGELGEKRAASDATIAARVSEAEIKIDEAKTAAMAELEDMSVEACNAVIEKLTGEGLAEGDVRAAVKAEIDAVMAKGGA